MFLLSTVNYKFKENDAFDPFELSSTLSLFKKFTALDLDIFRPFKTTMEGSQNISIEVNVISFDGSVMIHVRKKFQTSQFILIILHFTLAYSSAS